MLGGLFAACLLLAPIHIVAQQGGDGPQAKCVVEGTAVDFASGELLRKAKIELIPLVGTVSGQIVSGQIAITDAAGYFHLEGIPEGEYELDGARAGYIKSEFGARRPGGEGTPLRLKAGDKVMGLALKLARRCVITGKVLDEGGEPIQKALVYAVSRSWIHGQREYFTSQDSWTNDAGEYRIVDLRPGQYYLEAATSLEVFVEKQGGREKRAIWSFYPGSRTLDSAVLLDVQSGQDLPGINFQLRAEPVFHLRGKLVGTDLHDPENRLSLSAHLSGLSNGIVDLDSEMKPDGSFDFPGAPAGSYEIELLNEEYKQTVKKINVQVTKSDVNGLIISVPSRLAIKGIIHRSDGASAALSQMQVIAADTGSPMMSQPYKAGVQPDGSFQIENVWPGRYVFGLAGQEQGEYVKSIRYSGQEILGVPIELANSTGQIEITVSSGAGQIVGSIQAGDSDVSVGGLQVLLASEAQRADAGGALVAKTDQGGHVSFNNVAPGRYYALAVADVDPGLLQSREFIDQFKGNGVEVEVPENGDLRIGIPILPDDAVQRALSNLGL